MPGSVRTPLEPEWRAICSAGDEAFDLGSQTLFVDDSVFGEHERPVVVDEHEGRATVGAESAPQVARLVVELGEVAGAGLVDEADEVSARGQPGDADEGDLVTEIRFDLRDRRAFCSTRRSPWGPEPEHQV